MADQELGEARGKVTIPIDWDFIVDNFIKNTNTNVLEENKKIKRKATNGIEEDDVDEEDEEDEYFWNVFRL